jgi:hypothetical protein
MSTQIQQDHFTDALYLLLDETFDTVYHLGEIRQALCTLRP